MPKYINMDALLKELEQQEDELDDWYTAHEMYNVVKYFQPATEIVPWEFLERYADWYCGSVSHADFVRMAKLFWERENGERGSNV